MDNNITKSKHKQCWNDIYVTQTAQRIQFLQPFATNDNNSDRREYVSRWRINTDDRLINTSGVRESKKKKEMKRPATKITLVTDVIVC